MGRGSTRKKPVQRSLEQAGSLPLLKKPNEVIGKEFTVPGSYWGAAATRGEAKQEYICIISDFSLLHTFSPTDRGAAMKIVEAGVTGKLSNPNTKTGPSQIS
ncbi:hypothetical protein AB1Y20_003777 [Prymnesium parvum]|uniref:Uncharacterized protein n=1 Tax=Prymnesium parvum TaxID=97485 RepID=A0AB34J7Y5_PRYPA